MIEIKLLPPQFCILSELDTLSVSELSQPAKPIVPILPEIIKSNNSNEAVFALPGDSLHSTSLNSANFNRITLKKGIYEIKTKL